MKRIFLLLYLIICFGLKAQTYYFDSVLVGSYKGELHQYQLADTTITSVCYNDTLNINEGNFPNSSYLKAKDSCYNTTPGGDLIQYYADTSFVRLPYPSCECFNGKYYSFNDSLKLRYFDLPDNTRFFWFYGRKYWSPVTGWVGIKRESIETEEIKFNVYPNPSRTKASIFFSNGYLPKNLKGIITDINGKEILTLELSKEEASAIINTELLSNGIYFVKIQDYDRVYVKRIVVAH